MLRLQKFSPDFNYQQWSLRAVVKTEKNEPMILPPPVKKEPIRLQSFVKRSECTLLQLLNKAQKKSLEYASKSKKNADNVCTECGKGYNHTPGFRNVSWVKHSLSHTAVDQYRCYDCSFMCREALEMKEHLCREHQISERRLPVKTIRIDYTEAELDLIDEKARQCFPDWGAVAPPLTDLSFLKRETVQKKVTGTSEYCELCQEEVCSNKREMYTRKEEHTAEEHTDDFTVWKCNKCTYGSNDKEEVGIHFKKAHTDTKFNENIHVKMAGHPERRKLSAEVLKCFPNTQIPRLIL